MFNIGKSYLLLVSAGFFLFLLVVSSVSPVITRGEGREGLVVKALGWGENFILPLRHGTEVPSKPPLFHWIGYGASAITGEIGSMEIRSGSAVGTVLLVSGTYLFFSSHAGTLLGLLTTLILLSSLEVLRYSTQARVDPLFAGVFCSATYCMFSFYIGKGSRLLTGLGSFLFLVLSVLTKGPFGLLLPAGVLVLYLIANWRLPDFKVLSKGVAIFIMALLVASIWYYLAYEVGGDRFLEVQLLKENAYRIVKAEGDERGHEKPFYFTFIYLFLAFIPWSLFLPRILSGLKALKKEGEFSSNQILILSSAWLLLFVLAVMGSVSKRSVYFLPALPVLSFIASISFVRSQGLVLAEWIRAYEKLLGLLLQSVLVLLMSTVLLLLVSSYILPVVEVYLSSEKFQQLRQVTDAIGVVELVTYFAVLIFVYREISKGFLIFRTERIENGIITVSFALILMFFASQTLIAARIMALESPENFVRKVIEILPVSEPDHSMQIVQYRNEYYAPAFYMDRTVPVVQEFSELPQCGDGICSFETYVFISESDMQYVRNIKYEIVLKSNENLANRGEKLILLKLYSIAF